MHRTLHPDPSLIPDENTTRTISQAQTAQVPLRRPLRRCSYIATEGWHYGDGDPFCSAPAVPESSYCAEHRALCRLAPGSAAADRAAAALQRAAEAAPGPPAELGFPDLPAMPELDGELDADDIAHCLDLPDPTQGGDA